MCLWGMIRLSGTEFVELNSSGSVASRVIVLWLIQMIQQFNTGLNGLGNLSYYYSRLHIYGVQKKELANIWLSFLHYTDKYNEQLRIEPDMPQPKSINQQRQRHVKTKMWSKMILILEINGIPSHESSQLLATPNARASICELIQRGIDNDTVSDLLELFKFLKDFFKLEIE